MAIEIRYEPEKGFLIIVVKGKPSPEEYKTAMDEITQSEQYPADINAIWDVTEQDFRKVDTSIVRHIIEISKQYPERCTSRVAFIAKDDLAFGMLRMYEILSSTEESGLSQNVGVFRTYSEGEKWLLEE